MKPKPRPSCDDVLEAFALEPEAGKTTLDKYLRTYPEYSEAILDYAIEISHEDVPRQEPLSIRERALITAGWQKHVQVVSKPILDPFASLTLIELNKIADALEVPKQVLTALRDRLIVVASIPKRFSVRIAMELRTEVDALLTFLTVPPALSDARSRKSVGKPKITPRKTFAQVLVDAGVSVETQKKLMLDD